MWDLMKHAEPDELERLLRSIHVIDLDRFGRADIDQIFKAPERVFSDTKFPPPNWLLDGTI